MSLLKNTKKSAIAVATLMMLGACGGGDESGPMSEAGQGTQSAVQFGTQDGVLKDQQDSITTASDSVSVSERLSAQSVPANLTHFNFTGNFYTGANLAWIRTMIINNLHNKYLTHKLRNPGLNLPSISSSEVGTDPSKATTAYNALPDSVKNELHTIIQNNIFGETTTGSIHEARPFLHRESLMYRDWIINMPAETVNGIYQHHQRTYHQMLDFARAWTERAATDFANKAARQEVLDDARFLKGTVNDTIVEGKDWLGRPNGQLTISLGNSRKEVERAELVRTNGWLMGKIFGAKYTAVSNINHGVNSTKVEPEVGRRLSTEGRITSDAFVLSDDQTNGLKYYVDEDIKKNGPYEGMSVEDSKRMLNSAAKLVSQETGLVYESYVVAQLLVRSGNQVTVAYVRAALFSKTIDLSVIQLYLKTQAEATPAFKALGDTMQGRLAGGITLLVGGIFAAGLLAVIAIDDARDVVAKNKSLNTTAAVDAAEAANRTRLRLTAATTGASLASVGILGLAGFSRTAAMDGALNKWIGRGFAASDLTGAIAEYIDVFRSGTQRTAAGQSRLVAASFRAVGGTFTISEYVYKLFNWRWDRFPGSSIAPLEFNTWTASFAGMFYALGAAMLVM
jgi:hypothetical protein